MASVNIKCPKCKSDKLRVRNSARITHTAGYFTTVCQNCFTKSEWEYQCTKLSKPHYEELPPHEWGKQE